MSLDIPAAAGGAVRLVASKLAPRPGAARFLARPRLIDALREAEGAKLVLVRAPAGFGKTTLMAEHAQWLQSRGVATAWLTLDDGDNDVSRFIAHMLAAFQAVDPTLALMTTAGPRQPAPGGDVNGAALDLVHHLSEQAAPFAIFLDNLELIQDSTVLGMVRMLLDALPLVGRMILGTRETPDLGLARLRVHGHLMEIGPDALRFSFEESLELLRSRCQLDLSDEQVRLLHQRTEGWAAALWLAALALRERHDPGAFVRSFSGSNAAVADYLLEDVLSRQPLETRCFLLSTSVLDELVPPLCDRITGRDDSRELLSALEKAGLFVLPQSQERGSYRYHPLFRDFLYAQLARTSPARPSELHRTAAHWHLQQGQPVPAIVHLIRGREAKAAAELLGRHAEPLLWKGRVRLLARLYDELPAAVAPDADPQAKLCYGWALIFTHRYGEALAQLGQLEAHAGRPAGLRPQVEVQRAFILAMADRVDEALAAWEAIHGHVDPETHPFPHSIQHNSFAFCLIAANRFTEALEVLEAGRPSHRRIASSFNLAVAACLEGAIALARGDARAAIARCRDALTAATSHPGQHVSGSTIAAAFLADALYAGDKLDEAEKLLDAYLPLINEVAAPDQVISSHVTLARIAQQRGDRSRALELLDALERLGEQQALTRFRRNAYLERARLALLEGDPRTAQAALERAQALGGETPGRRAPCLHADDIENLLMGRLRLAIHSGRASDAIAPLHAEIGLAEQRQRLRQAHRLRILLALALARSDRRDEALHELAQTLAFSERGGLQRAFADEGPQVLALLAELRERQRQGAVPGRGPAPAPQPAADTAPTAAADGPLPAQALTGRERRILALLAEGHANKAIAQRMNVSESTVKTHLRNINAKLGAENRTHAVALARRLGWLPAG